MGLRKLADGLQALRTGLGGLGTFGGSGVPTIASATADSSVLTLTFSGNVTYAGGNVSLNGATGMPTQVVNYVSGNGTPIIVFSIADQSPAYGDVLTTTFATGVFTAGGANVPGETNFHVENLVEPHPNLVGRLFGKSLRNLWGAGYEL